MNYFVCALPRSRTAWLSVLLSQSGQFCYHEGLNGCSSISEYKDKLGDCGDSTTGIHLFGVNKLFSGAPVVVIEKSKSELQECFDWCFNTYGTDKKLMQTQYDQLMNVSGMRVKQEDITVKMDEIFEHLTGCEFKAIYRNLADLNIQSYPDRIDFKAASKVMNEAI
jgi:hypothetical protein